MATAHELFMTGATSSVSSATDPSGQRRAEMWNRFDPSRPMNAVLGAVLLGAFAGIVASLFLTVTGELPIKQAIAIEKSHTDPNAHEDELVSRSAQSGPGRFAAYAVGGAAYGLLFGVAFVGMVGQPNPFRRALVAGAVLAGTLTLVPFLKYPPNPPSVGRPDTLHQRQLLYTSLLLLTLVVLLFAARLSSRLRAAGWLEDRRVAVVVVAVVGPVLALLAVFPPAPDPVPAPATLVWHFRLASLGGNLLLWAVLAFSYGLTAAASERRRSTGSGAYGSTTWTEGLTAS
jgi:hypothetical protein